ncbi:MAG: potassium transporter KefB [Methylococcales bacterium]|nr:potassium transporter KefB [Methylococcales bacterium]
MDHSILTEVIVLLAVSVFIVATFRRLHLPPIIGYLGVGMITGPHGMSWVSSTHDLHFISEFGVVFLLFSIGLEFSLGKLWQMRHSVLGIGGGQVTITAGIFGLMTLALGLPWETAFVVGGALAMSSTAIVIKQLNEQVELNSRHGQLSVGVLLFQDLAVVPFLVLIPLLTADSGDGQMVAMLSWAFLKGTIVFVVMMSVGHLLKPLFHEVALAKSTELFTLTVLLITLGAAYLTEALGLSLALGAFLAGVMLSETHYKHQIELDIRPFQDVLLGLFFITVGMITDFHVLMDLWYWIFSVALALLLVKAVLVFGVAKALKVNEGVSLRAGLVLSQGGEFGFVLLALAVKSSAIADDVQQFVLSVIFVSMLLAPFVIRLNGRIATAWCGLSYRRGIDEMVEHVAEDAGQMEGHVILCGYGHVGQKVATVLDNESFSWVALDLNPELMEASGHLRHVHFGDACRSEILTAAGLDRAKAVVITFVDLGATVKLLHQIRALSVDIAVIVRSKDDLDVALLRELGATEIIPELVESSMMVVSQLLVQLDVDADSVFQEMEAAWRSRYPSTRGRKQG